MSIYCNMQFFLFLLSLLTYDAFAQESKIDCNNWRSKLEDEGNIILIAGDKGFTPPTTIAEIESIYCKRQLRSLDRIRLLARNCMKPFPRQLIGLVHYGARKEVRALCKGSIEEKQHMLGNDTCFRVKPNLDKLHQAMEVLTLKYETIRDNVRNESLKIPHVCCQLNNFFDVSSFVYVFLLHY